MAAVTGHAIGVGATLSLACDVRFVAEDAAIQFVFVRLGLVSELGSHAILPRVVGLSHASDLLLSGRRIDGREAERIGWASRSLPTAEVLPAALAWAREVAENVDPEAAAASKSILWSERGHDLQAVMAAEVTAMTALARRDTARATVERTARAQAARRG